MAQGISEEGNIVIKSSSVSLYLQNVLVKSGLQKDDIVILSDVKDGEKIKIIK